MYKFSYAEILDDTPQAARAIERRAIIRAIALLEAAVVAGPSSQEAVEALSFVRRLWAVLIEDLAHPKNALPQALRADLISIGLSVMTEAERTGPKTSPDFRALIEIMTSVAAGLA